MKRNLYLVGFMGTGKSAVGRQVARRLDLQFIDSDAAIEAAAGRPIREIFEEDGEEHFRKLEREFVETGHPEGGCVVACGGGLVTQEGMIDLLKSKGVVVSLFASADTILRRTSGNEKRPLLNVEDPKARIEELLAARNPFYVAAGSGVSTENRTLADVASHVVRVYRGETG